MIDAPGTSIDEMVELFLQNFEKTYEICVIGGTLTGDNESRAVFYAAAEDIVMRDPIANNQPLQRKLLEKLEAKKIEALSPWIDEIEEMFIMNAEKLLEK